METQTKQFNFRGTFQTFIDQYFECFLQESCFNRELFFLKSFTNEDFEQYISEPVQFINIYAVSEGDSIKWEIRINQTDFKYNEKILNGAIVYFLKQIINK